MGPGIKPDASCLRPGGGGGGSRVSFFFFLITIIIIINQYILYAIHPHDDAKTDFEIKQDLSNEVNSQKNFFVTFFFLNLVFENN